MVNFTNTRPVNSRLFEHISTNMECHHRRLLLHTDVSWLSRGIVPTRVHDLRQELMTFFYAIKQSYFFNRLQREFWNTVLQYLASICENLNTMILCMQGKEENINTSTDKNKCLRESYRYG